jgi:hypothetical protein
MHAYPEEQGSGQEMDNGINIWIFYTTGYDTYGEGKGQGTNSTNSKDCMNRNYIVHSTLKGQNEREAEAIGVLK